MIRALIFDCFGVLYTGSFGALREMCPPERWRDAEDLNKQADYGYISRADYLIQMAEVVGVEPEALDKLLMQRHVRNTALLEYVATARQQYKTAFLSNVSDGLINRLFTQREMDELFDEVIISSEEGIVKPHPGIYTLAATELGLHPEECIMVDDLSSNCEGAEMAGMWAVQHVRNGVTIAKIEQCIKANRA